MDIQTLNVVIDMLRIRYEQAADEIDFGPYYEGKTIGAYAALTRVEALLREELEHRDARTA